jgi:hypothetical protein
MIKIAVGVHKNSSILKRRLRKIFLIVILLEMIRKIIESR